MFGTELPVNLRVLSFFDWTHRRQKFRLFFVAYGTLSCEVSALFVVIKLSRRIWRSRRTASLFSVGSLIATEG